jgi:hypothetical protein
MVHERETVLGGWDAGVLATLVELNEQLLELLAGAETHGFLATELRTLAPQQRARLARCPYLLIDARFAEPQYWQGPLLRVMDTQAQGCFASADGRTLLRRCLLFAWHLASTNRVMARVTLGMDTLCAEQLTQCRLRDLEWLAELSPAWIRPCWQDQPQFWQRLIAAARRDNRPLLRQLQWHGLTRLAANAGQLGSVNA